MLVWSSNDYLGMGGHPVVVEAACAAAREMGAGAGGTRNISGTSPAHDALEAELADLHGKPAALLFTSGFVSNQAALSTILNSLPDWQVFSDAQEPRLDDRRHQGLARRPATSSATTTWRIWRSCCARRRPAAPKLIAFESVYSMDADIAPIGAICDLADALRRDDLPGRGARGRHVRPVRRRRGGARRRRARGST